MASPAAALVADLLAAAAPLADLLSATASELTGVGASATAIVWDGEEGSDLASPAAALQADRLAAATPPPLHPSPGGFDLIVWVPDRPVRLALLDPKFVWADPTGIYTSFYILGNESLDQPIET